MKNTRKVSIINIYIVSIALMALFLPFFSIVTYSVNMYDLSRVEIAKANINYFETVFGNYYFKGKVLMLFYILILVGLIITNYILFKSKNDKTSVIFTVLSLALSLSGVILLSFSNTIYAGILGGKTYMYQGDLLKIANNITPIETSGSYRISYWISENIGCFILIALLSISFFLTFYFQIIDEKNRQK